MYFLSRLRPSRPPPDFEITSPLPVSECLRLLTGKEQAGWQGNEFIGALRLEGRVREDHISVRLPSGYVTGDIETDSSVTYLRLRAREGITDRRPAIGDTILILAASAPFITYDLSQGTEMPGFLIISVSIIAIRWYYESRRRWPEYPQNAEELARMLANMLGGSNRTTARSEVR